MQKKNSTLINIAMIAFLAASLAFTLTPSQTVQAAGPYTVNTFSDTHCDGYNAANHLTSPGCIAATDVGGSISLRSAIEYATTVTGSTTINLPAGTYNLTLGDLMPGTLANTSITIQGTGAGSTIINQTQAGKLVFDVNFNVSSNVVFNLSGVTVTGGSENELDTDGFGGNGGAILAGGPGNSVSISNVTFSGNYCSPVSNDGCTGGAISMTAGGDLIVTNSTFTGNTASKNRGFGGGGAIYFDNGGTPGNVTITGSTFTNNTAQGNSTTGGVGGALFLAGGSGTTYTLTNNVFTGNAANGTGGAHGGAIYKPSGTLNASFNRIKGNTSAGDASGLYVGNNAGSIGNATNNWWGCNAGPSAAPCDTAVLGSINQGGTMTVSPWIVLTNTASPNPIQVNQTTTLTADFLHNSSGGTFTASQIPVLIGLPVTWGGAANGALSNQQTTIQANGAATATFTASAAGAGSATATVDNATATGSVTINKADTTTTITSETPDPTVTGQQYTVNFTMTSNTGSSPTAPTGTVTVSDGAATCTAAFSSGTCNLTSTTAGAKTLTAKYNGDGNFNISTSTPGTPHTVNKADTTAAITGNTPNSSVTGQQVTFNFSVSANAPGSGTPSGTVNVTDGGTNTCTGSVGAGGTGSCSIAFPAAGSYSMTATYTGDGNYNASPASAPVSQTVDKANTTTTITQDNPDPSLVGQQVTVNYTVAATSPGTGTPTGSVTVSDGPATCTGSLNNSGAGSCGLTFNTTGAHTLTAVYGGDSNYNGSTSAGEPHSVNQAPAITSANSAAFTEGQAGTFTVTSTGFPTPSLSETGALPSGVSFTDNGDGTATLAGTPASGTAGTYPLTITAHNGAGTDANQSFTLTVKPPLAITSADHTTFVVGSSGAFTVTTVGTPTPTLSETGALPGGVTFTDNGDGTATLAGTPAAGSGGTYALVITAHNGVAPDATQNFTLTVTQPPVITSADHTTFTVGSAGTFAVTTTAFPTAALSETGALPNGVTFVDNGNGTATLSGTPASGTGGVYPITITAQNTAGPTPQSFTLTVNQAPAITSANNVTFTAGSAGSFSVTATGFPTPALSESGSLPGGVTFVDNGNGTATLSGTPAANAGGVYNLTLTASSGVSPNATQPFTLTVNQAPAITSPDHVTFTEGQASSFTITATGYPTPTITGNGPEPSGVFFTSYNNGTATFSGTPAAGSNGTYTLTLTASNGVGSNAVQSFTITVVAYSDMTITKSHSGDFTQLTSGSYTITASNSGGLATSGTVTVKDTLPAGLTATTMSGNGWTCTLSTTTCTRSDALAGGSSYPPITLTVFVGLNAPASLTNSVTVSGGGEQNTANDTATDPTTVKPAPTYGQVTPLTATCGQFAANTAASLNAVTYTVSSGKVKTVNPSAFFYYTKVLAPAASFSIKVTQSNTAGWPNLGNAFSFAKPQINVFNANCQVINATGVFMPTSITFNVTGATPGAAYYVGIRYQADSVLGKKISGTPPTVPYTFTTALNTVALPQNTATINFKPQ